jgi:hypothetical protein
MPRRTPRRIELRVVGRPAEVVQIAQPAHGPPLVRYPGEVSGWGDPGRER